MLYWNGTYMGVRPKLLYMGLYLEADYNSLSSTIQYDTLPILQLQPATIDLNLNLV